MKILATAFLALVLWIGWLIVSVQFGVSDGLRNAHLSGGQSATLAALAIPAALLTCASLFMLVRLPFKARKRKRVAAAGNVDES